MSVAIVILKCMYGTLYVPDTVRGLRIYKGWEEALTHPP